MSNRGLGYFQQVLAAKAMEAASNGDAYGGDLVARSFFKSIFLFADKDNKGELVVNDLKILFQVRCTIVTGAILRGLLTHDNQQSVCQPSPCARVSWLLGGVVVSSMVALFVIVYPCYPPSNLAYAHTKTSSIARACF